MAKILWQSESQKQSITTNKHLEHLEDSVWQWTVKEAYDILSDTRKVLRQWWTQNNIVEDQKNMQLTIKYDWAPAIVFWCDYQGKFFLSTKAALAKNPTLLYSEEDIQKFCHGKAQLCAKLLVAFRALSQQNWQWVYQADLLYTPNDLYEVWLRQKKNNVDQKHNSEPIFDAKWTTHIGFSPNTLQYLVEKNTPLAAEIQKSDIWLIVHTGYEWLEDDGIQKLSKTPFLPAYTLPENVRSPSLSLTLRKKIATLVAKDLPKPDTLLKKQHIAIAKRISRFMSAMPYITHADVQKNLNKALREQDDTTTYWQTAEAREQFFAHWAKIIGEYYHKNIKATEKKITTRETALQKHKKEFSEKMRTYKKALAAQKSSSSAKKQVSQPKLPVETQAHQKAQSEYKIFVNDKKIFERSYTKDIQHVEKNHDLLEQWIDMWLSLQQQKDSLIEALDKSLDTQLVTFLPWIDHPVGWEWYVVTHSSGSMMKLVDRAVFSKTNFLAEENWMLNGKTLFVVYGRMNPPTKAHIAMIKDAALDAKNHGAPLRVYITRTQDDDKNPLPPELKVQVVQEALAAYWLTDVEVCIVDENNGNLLTVVEWVAGEWYRNIVLTGWSDRLELMDQATHMATEQWSKLFYKVSGTVRSELIDATQDLSWVSATKVRDAARVWDRELFDSLLAQWVSESTRNSVRVSIRENFSEQ